MLPKVALLDRLVSSGVIAVLRGIPEDKIEQVAESLVEGNVTALEVTLDSPGAFETIKKLSTKFKNDALVGAGTVLDPTYAQIAINNGAEFIFSPCFDRDVVKMTLRNGKISAPGVMTPTEMVAAIEAGADLVKIFPAAGLGIKYIKDVKGPLPHIPVIPTGGVNLDNIAEFIHAGVAAVGAGGNLLDKEAIATSNFAKITELAKKYTEAMEVARRE
jgi:2-dehydro-3-deoxyphosphogluconate aldolase/(4S)-4-hydroxy-2-oxoglutarate aldolase